jgi:hypothetical protein
MTQAFSRFSENALFSVLIAVFVGSLAVSAVADRSAHASPAPSALARAAANGGNS